jgi:hypothetical protein
MARVNIVGVVFAFLVILSGRSRVGRLPEPEQMSGMQREVAGQMIAGDRKAAEDFGQINPLPEGHLFASFHVSASARSLVAAGFFSDSITVLAEN